MSVGTDYIGRTISGRYRITKLIASGGMGAVFEGEHLKMRKRVAIKILHADLDGLELLAAQFEREAVAGAHISHPNVASATDMGELEDGSYFLVMEYLRGQTLAELLEHGPLPPKRAVHIARQIAEALNAIHEMGIVHRDVKSQNVMLIEDTDDHAKLIDFGFAKVPLERVALARADDPLHDLESSMSPDTMLGTIGYLAPEAAKGIGAIDGRSDLYALGVIMCEMLTGKRPFSAPTKAELFKLHRDVPAPPFIELAPLVAVPAPLEAITLRLLAKSPEERFQTGADVIAALDRAAIGRPRMLSTVPPPNIADVDIPSSMLTRRRSPSRLRKLFYPALLLAGAAATIYYVPAVRHELRDFGVPIPLLDGESAAEASEPAPSATEVEGLGAAAWAGRLLAAAKSKDYPNAEKALSALAVLDPTALRAREVAAAAESVAVGAAASQAQQWEPIFELLLNRFGSDGLDVLYGIVESQNAAHPAYKRAFGELRQAAVRERATPALRIAIELRDAKCEDKAALFDRAALHGDARALDLLKSLQRQPCRSAKHPCCFRANQALKRTIDAITQRISSR